MTNPSPPEPNQPLKERRKRPATGVTFDEMVAIIVAFSTIGSILFWTLGLKDSRFAGNFGLNGSGNVLTSDKTTNTGLGIGSVLGGSRDDVKIGDVDGKSSFSASLNGGQSTSDNDNSVVASVDSGNRSGNNSRGSSGFNTGAKLAPLAGVATLPAWKGRQGQGNLGLNFPNRGKPGWGKNQGKKPNPPGGEAGIKPPKIATEAPPKEAIKAPPKEAVKAPAVEKPAPKPPVAPPKKTEIPKDVTPTYWAYPFVKQMNDQALLPEFSKDQNFDPDGLITRGAMATLLSQAFGNMPDVNSTKKFQDVASNNEITKNINKAVSTGFMKGYSEYQFRPEQNIPRYQVLVTLATGLGLKPSQNADQILQKFGDASQIPDWAKEQVAAAAEAGFVVNPPNSKAKSLTPDKAATRGEVAAMIHQALVNKGLVKPLESEFIVKP